MSTNYPASLDSYSTKSGAAGLNSPDHAGAHNDLQDAVVAIETELGTDPAGAASTVKDRIAATEAVANAAYTPGGTDVAVADGGTGASTAAGARTNLGLVIGTDVQAHSAVLDATTASFTTADETKLDGIETAADVTDAANVSAAGAPIITSGAGAPSSTPSKVGDIYVDTTGDTVWSAAGTASSADWKQATGAGGGDLLAANNLSDLANAATARTNLGLAIGTNVQAQDAELQAIAGLTSVADRVPYFTGSGTAALATFTSFGRSLVDDASASAARTTLGLTIGTNVQAFDADLSTIAAANNGSVLAATTASFTTADETKLDGVATGATANSSDATLLARANHTGTQLASTISDFDTQVRTSALSQMAKESARAAETGTTYTLAQSDHGKIVPFSNAALVTATIPTNASVAIAVGTRIVLHSTGAGGLTLSTTGITLNGSSPNTTIAQNEAMWLEKTATDTWSVLGGTAA